METLSEQLRESLALRLPELITESIDPAGSFMAHLTWVDAFLLQNVESAVTLSSKPHVLDKTCFNRASARAMVEQLTAARGAYEQLLAYYCAELMGAQRDESDEMMIGALRSRATLAGICAENCEWYTSHNLADGRDGGGPTDPSEEVQYEWIEKHLKTFGASASKKTRKSGQAELAAVRSDPAPSGHPPEVGPQAALPVSPQPWREKMELAREGEREGDKNVDRLAGGLTDLAIREGLANARARFFEVATALRSALDRLQASPSSDADADADAVNAVRNDLTRVCKKVQAMRDLEGHETHRLKTRAPTEAAIQQLRERSAIDIGRPDDREMLQYMKDGGKFLELKMQPKPVHDVHVPPYYVHGHLAEHVDVSRASRTMASPTTTGTAGPEFESRSDALHIRRWTTKTVSPHDRRQRRTVTLLVPLYDHTTDAHNM